MSTIVTDVVGVRNLLGSQLAYRSMKLLYSEYLMYLKGIGFEGEGMAEVDGKRGDNAWCMGEYIVWGRE